MTIRPSHWQGLALRTSGLTSTERLVLAELAGYARYAPSGRAAPFREDLTAALNLTERTIARALARLIELGYITETTPARPGSPREFAVHPEAWPGPGFDYFPGAARGYAPRP